MNVIKIMICIVMFILASCGGGGSSSGGNTSSSGAPLAPEPQPEPELVAGVFMDGMVEGLRYETETQSGLTDSSGEYFFYPGEIVTFSIGGIVLGSVQAEAELNPFSLRGISPPDTESELRLELSNSVQVSEFDRAANIAMLLVALDGDSDHTNGLDLSGWDALLSDAQLEIGFEVYDFQAQAFNRLASKYDLRKNIFIAEPLMIVYEYLDLVVSAHAVISFSDDSGNDGEIEETYTATYSPEGYRIQAFSGFEGDNVSGATITSSFGDFGRRINYSESYDSDGNGVSERMTESVFSEFGNLVTQTINYFHNDDDVITARRTINNSYDENGNQLSSVEQHFDAGDDVVTRSNAISYSNNSSGFPLSKIEELDSDGDGEANNRETTTWSYDENDNILSELLEKDDGANDSINYRSLNTYTWDAKGNMLTREFQEDESGDGFYVEFTYYSYTYDTDGNLLTKVVERDLQTEIPDEIVAYNIDTTNYTFDVDGRVLTAVFTIRNADNELLSTTTNTYSYDNNGRRVTTESGSFDADGNYTSYSVTEYSYDENGNTVSMFNESGESPEEEPGTPDLTTYTYTYGEGGNILTKRSDRDFGQDGYINVTNFESYTYTTIENGLYYLINDYIH